MKTWKILDIVTCYRHANLNYNEYHLTLVRIAIIKMWEKGTFLYYWWECKLVQPLWKIAWRFLKILKIELLYDLAFPLLGIYLEKTKTNLKRHMHPNVHSNIIYNSQVMEATQMSINRGPRFTNEQWNITQSYKRMK